MSCFVACFLHFPKHYSNKGQSLCLAPLPPYLCHRGQTSPLVRQKSFKKNRNKLHLHCSPPNIHSESPKKPHDQPVHISNQQQSSFFFKRKLIQTFTIPLLIKTYYLYKNSVYVKEVQIETADSLMLYYFAFGMS